mgnify:CR=1 FL=1
MSVGASPDLYNILYTILSDVAPHHMNELYNIDFTDGTSSASSGLIALSSFVNKTIGSSGGGGSSSGIMLAFHHGTFSSSDYSSAYSTVSAATTAGHLYSNSPSGTYTWGTLGSPSSTSTNTTYTWTPTSTVTGKLLMVAGGGGGGGTIGGGGGAGGVVYNASVTLSGAKTIVVGNGGGGGQGWDYTPRAGTSGSNTTFTGMTTAIGGGAGGGFGTNLVDDPLSGGSGGGGHQLSTYPYNEGASGTAGPPRQGYDGGDSHSGTNYGGGGGGAGGAGGNSSGNNGGAGGIGVDYSSDFTTTYGDSGWFASGGGGGVRNDGSRVGGSASAGGGGDGIHTQQQSSSVTAQKHTGGGGGAGGFAEDGNNNVIGGSGGSGIVLFSGSVTSGGGGGGSGPSGSTLVFHHGTFSSSDYSSAYSTVSAATTAGHLYANSPNGTYTWGTLGTPSSTTTNTTYTWTPTGQSSGAKVLMVAGGGGTGSNNSTRGGGGAGELVFLPSQSISSSQQTIVVGNGGQGGASGYDTEFLSITANGGGASGTSGGSGGGEGRDQNGSPGSSVKTGSGYGNAGGIATANSWGGAGGGGGAGASGGSGGGGSSSSEYGGDGGDGLKEVTISGTLYNFATCFGATYGEVLSGESWFAGGGGGCVHGGNSQSPGDGGKGGGGGGGGGYGGVAAENGTNHTGAGGGGGYNYNKNGGSGIVIVKTQGVFSNITISTNVTNVPSTKITQFSTSSVTVSSVSGFSVNDWVMIHQTYYPSGNSNTTTVCPFEFKNIQGISGTTVTFTESIAGTFVDGAQMIYTYRCGDFTLNSGITMSTSNWDQSTYKGGIIPIYADGTVTINGTIDVSGKGYQGISSYYNTSTGGFQDGFQGNGYDSVKRGAGSGGLRGASGWANSGGGGGGGHLNSGGQGLGSGTNSGNVSGGVSFGSASGTYLTMGGSGGQGGFHDISGALQRGGHGGGAVYIAGNSITGSGTMNANGTSGFDNVGVRNYQGGAGGGAGGMVLFDVNTSTFSNVTVNGGSGLNGTNGSQQAVSSYRGGDGSIGRFIYPGSAPTYTYSSGFEWGYYNDNYHYGGYSGSQTWFNTRTPVHTHNSSGRSRVDDFSNISTASSGQTSVNGDETYSYLWTGYFKAPITSTYYFNTRSDDNSHMWIGSDALSPTYSNEIVDNGGLHGMQTVTSSGVSLTGGVYYDFRMTFGEQGGGDDMQAQWRNNSTSFSYDWSSVAFSNRQTSSGGGSTTELLRSKGLTGNQGYTMYTNSVYKDMTSVTWGRTIPSGYNPSSGTLAPSGTRYYWNDWSNDIFDAWGDFYIYNPSNSSASYISFATINGGDGTLYTETQTHHSKSFTIKHGWVTGGIFKLDVECSDDTFNFAIGMWGNMGSDGSTQNTDRQYSASWGTLSYNYNSQGNSSEWFYSHCIPKLKTFNDGITLSGSNFTANFKTGTSGNDNLAIWTETLTWGATFYFVKGSNSSSGAMYNWVENDIETVQASSGGGGGQTSSEYPPNAMQTNSSGGYTTSASSTNHATTFQIWKVHNKTVGDEGWHGNSSEYSTSTRNYIGSFSTSYDGGSTVYGEWIQLQVPTAITITKLQIAPRSGSSNYQNRCAGEGRILGSTNGSSWSTVDSFTGKTYTTGNYTDITVSTSSSYTYFRLVITRLSGSSGESTVNIGEIKYFGY